MDETFFRREHKELARDLLGRKVQMSNRSFFILGAEGFPKEKNDGLYEPVTTVTPGNVYCPKFHNHCLVLIACLSKGTIGGCVLIRAIEFSNGEMIMKPGLAAEAMGITEHGVTGAMYERDGLLELGFNGVDRPKIDTMSKKIASGVSENDVRIRMSKIVKVYMERRKTTANLTFQAFLAQCFTCASPRELGMLLNT